MPRVSAIIIVLNGADYIAEAIRSVLAQDFGDWELLVVDDGSVDRTREIVRRFVDAHPDRVRLLRHPDQGNHGMSATRNLGLEHASGEFIAFLDADDVWTPTKLADQVALLDAHQDLAMVYGRTLIWHSWDRGSYNADRFYELGVAPNAVYDPPRLFFQLLDNVHQTPTTCNAMMRRKVVLDLGGFDPSFHGMFEDQIFFAKLLLNYPVYVSGECWAKYRQHERSASAQASGANAVWKAQLRYLRALRAYLLHGGHRLSRARVVVERKIAGLYRERIAGAARRRLRVLVRK